MSLRKSITEKFNNSDETVTQELSKYYFRSSIILSSISFVLLALSIIFFDNVNQMSFISPYFVIIICGINLIIAAIIMLYYLKKCNNINLANNKKIFNIYDIVTFVLETIMIISFVTVYLFTPTVVVGNSMENTYYDGDRVIIWNLGYTPKTDDVVVVDTTGYGHTDGSMFIKRVVATSGDLVTYTYKGKDIGDLYVNNELVISDLREYKYEILISYSKDNEKKESILDKNSKVILGYSIVIGDNRSNSIDSRDIGAISNDDILGKAIFRFYSKYSKIGNPDKDIK